MTTGKIILKRGGASALDLPMAALAALSVGFVAFAMPDALFTGAVQASGLPSLLPAAEPPLGTTARLAVVIAAAVAAFACTWLLLRALGNMGSPRPRHREATEVEAPPLRLRRADAHPDAPLRRPLVAGLDLGEPEPIEPPAEEETSPSVVEAEARAEEIVDGEWDEASDLPPMELEEPTIADLMERLERGLVRRQRVAAPAETPEESPAILAPAIDDRLRSALDDLQRLAARRA